MGCSTCLAIVFLTALGFGESNAWGRTSMLMVSSTSTTTRSRGGGAGARRRSIIAAPRDQGDEHAGRPLGWRRPWGSISTTASSRDHRWGRTSVMQRFYSTDGDDDHLLFDEGPARTRNDGEDEEHPSFQYSKTIPFVPTSVPNRQQHFLSIDSKQAAVCSRTIPITTTWSITVWEWQSVSPVIETYWQVEQQGLQVSNNNSNLHQQQPQHPQSTMLDPFGLVTWPGSVVATLELLRHQNLVQDKVVFVIGAGVGVEAQAAAALGAKRVIATDVHPTTLKLLEYGVEQAPDIDSNRVESRIWDLFGTEEIPDEVDLIVCADVLYNDNLAKQIIKRMSQVYQTNDVLVVDDSDDDVVSNLGAVNETSINTTVISDTVAINASLTNATHSSTSSTTNKVTPKRQPPTTLIVDSQRFCHGFEHDLNAELRKQGRRRRVAWESRYLPSFTGSGILVEDDQTYDVKARVLWIGI